MISTALSRTMTCLLMMVVLGMLASWEIRIILHNDALLDYVLSCKLGVERTPDPKYPTRRSAKVLKSKINVYFISTVPFSLWVQSSWCQSSENCCPINRLATTWHIPLNKAANIEDIIQSTSGKPDPDPTLIWAYVPNTRPDICVCM